ncbi:MAG TPA: hypothetical protein ENG11_04145 [candidate division Zixibacteria bacterium]|nr:hypothetical protein [candidate division Zixibacteria bacterium]
MKIPSPKRRRLTIALFRAPVLVGGDFIVVKVLPSPEGKSLLISVPKKCGKAVRRNRIRRIIREWFRLRWNQVPENISILVQTLPATTQLSKNKLSPSIRAELEKFFPEIIKYAETTHLSDKSSNLP